MCRAGNFTVKENTCQCSLVDELCNGNTVSKLLNFEKTMQFLVYWPIYMKMPICLLPASINPQYCLSFMG